MNDLSFMLYLAGVVGNLKFFMGALLFAAILSTVIYAVAFSIMTVELKYANTEEQKEAWATYRKIGLSLVLPLWVICVLGGFIPSQNTVHLIIASEMGERVATSETGAKSLELVDSWLDAKLKEVNGEE